MKKPNNFVEWALALLILLLIGVAFLIDYFHLSQAWEQTLQIGVIVLVYGLIALWWRANPADMVPPKLKAGQGEDGDYLTPVQAHYRHTMKTKIKRT